MKRQSRGNTINRAFLIGWLLLLFSVPVSAQTCTAVDLAQIPLEALAPSPAPANVVFLLDDSTSMDAEVLLSEDGPLEERSYLFDNAGDNATDSSDYYYDQEERKQWRYQWHGFNRLYYNPAVTYEPWLDPDNPGQTLGPADDDNPRSNPMVGQYTQDLNDPFFDIPATSGERVEVDDSDVSNVTTTGIWSATATEHFTSQNGATFTWTPTLPQTGPWSVWVFNMPGNLDDQAVYHIMHAGGISQVIRDQNASEWVKLGNYTFGTAAAVKVIRQNSDATALTNADQVLFLPAGESIPVAHYYLQGSSGTPYLVTLGGEPRYFKVEDQAEGQPGYGIVGEGELVEVAALPGEIDSGLSYVEDRQNFANWYSFHRKRSLVATSAVAKAIVGLEDMQVGLLTLNSTLVQPVLPIKIENKDQTGDMLKALYQYATGIESNLDTLLRTGLDCVGRYYSTDLTCNTLGDSPMATVAEGGACQKHFVVIVTDGAYNGTPPSDIGNQDGDQGTPYTDGYSNTLADVAMKYYKNDLSSTHEDIQRMHTFAVGFGVAGNLDRESYPANWPEPLDDATKIDDLWHATVNGRGEYYQSNSPDELVLGLQAIKDALLAFSGSSASVSATGEAVTSDNTVFVPSYESEYWTGDLKAYLLSENGSIALKWSAAKQLDGITAASRKVYTFNGTNGIEFLHALLSTEQKLLIESDQVDYIRGDQSMEQGNGGLFRTRPSILGDIVHSVSIHHNGTVYVGANDGMLHAFDVNSGSEQFAYIPYLPYQPNPISGGPPVSIFDRLDDLTKPNYHDGHRFFVDLTPAVGKVGGADYLVGGLGGGGKGYFGLDVSNPAGFSDGNVKWEFPNAETSQMDIDDVGYSFSRAMIVETQAGTKVIFGNGYNSENGHAVLFVLDPVTGDVDKKIDTGTGDCNGLSTPLVIDVDNDDIVDYAYAGDLRGNLWRFDLTADSTDGWKTEKLFQAKYPDGSGDEQPITTQPDAMFHCTGAGNGVLVTFGTGQYLGESDLDSDNFITETLYGIWDFNGIWNTGLTHQSAHNWGTLNHSTGVLSGSRTGFGDKLLEQEVADTVTENGGIYRVISNHPVYWKLSATSTLPESHGGWFVDLPNSGERAIADVAIRDFRVIAVSMQPSVEPCSSGGSSFVHLLNACSGGRDPLAQFDVNGDDEITGEDTVTDASGSQVTPSAIQVAGVAPQPLVLRSHTLDGAQTERLVFPEAFTSGQGVGSGSTGVVTVRPERRGTYYWREVR